MLLSGVSASYPPAHFGAIIGPSGCGKTSLLKFVAGIAPGEESGEIHWKGRSLLDEDFHASEIAYVPQFGIAHEELTARECVRIALDLRVRRRPDEDREHTVEALLGEAGVTDFENQRVKTLSGGQRRRLALAMELTSKPEILLCDEVTSGLDPRSENDIVRLLQNQSRDVGRLVLSVTHSLEHLELYDSVLVLYGGMLAYHGPSERLAPYFGVEHPEHLYSCLDTRASKEWADLWRQHREKECVESVVDEIPTSAVLDGVSGQPGGKFLHPGAWSQFFTLLHRRVLVFARSKSQILIQLAFVFGFPFLVALFAWDGLPAVKHLSMGLGLNGMDQVAESRAFLAESSKLGGLVSGIVMIQVILLTLMGANNSGREIASERAVFEKEKLSGLSPFAYVTAKAAFLFLLVCAQSLWMGIFVHGVCGFPGDLPAQLGYLLLVNAALTTICLAVSSIMRSAEQASLVSIYLVGFQLPLSGAVLALPEQIGPLVRPWISAYWGWAGILQTLRLDRSYDTLQAVIPTPLASSAVCAWVLCAHAAAGLAVAWIGCEQRRFE